MPTHLTKFGLFFLFVLMSNFTFAQRDYYHRDSTSYKVSDKLTYIAGKRHLYANKENTISLLKDFSVPGDTTFYIRDMDFITEQKGYVLVGRMYIGSETYLFKTEDGGSTFGLDTSYYNASQHKSINQVQFLNSQTIILFDGYYESGLLKSLDGGITWEPWFYSLIAHYFQMHKCQNGTWYVIGTPGDGFASYSFPLADSMWTIKNLPNFMSGCHNSAPHCIKVFRNGGSDRETDFIVKQIDTLSKICGLKTTLSEPIQANEILIYPNPVSSNICLIKNALHLNYQRHDTQGILHQQGTIPSNHHQLDLSQLPKGIYFITLGNHRQKILLQ
ncbi:MAG: T9SS type A sorting domain-containing protein [Bacteroidia bacterium]|nr:T9SS type A sorting domain-containing protein [Bacteroidia bacterium]MCF8425390.1 T9SS type A sorting domain-containing protein [Bacteroidia bacterium]MCF8446431.1 T9SS type A sorting domain-containing protein [Bacteroidia bacterium]